MANKSIKFEKRNMNRFRKIYNYIRKTPVFKFVSDSKLESVVGTVTFTNTAGPVTYTYPNTVSYSTAPVVVATPADENVNIYISSVSTTSVSFTASHVFTGTVHFQIFSQD